MRSTQTLILSNKNKRPPTNKTKYTTQTHLQPKKNPRIFMQLLLSSAPTGGWWSFGWVPWGPAAPWGMWQHWINWSSRRRRAINVASLRLSIRRNFLNTFLGVSLNGGIPHQNTTKMISFGRKTNSCWAPPILENPCVAGVFLFFEMFFFFECGWGCFLFGNLDFWNDWKRNGWFYMLANGNGCRSYHDGEDDCCGVVIWNYTLED